MKIGDRVYWRFKGDREFMVNEVLYLKGSLLCLGWQPSGILRAPVHWVKRDEIEIEIVEE